MPKKKKLYIVRKEFDGLGGAENVAKHYVEYFSENFNTQLVYAGADLESYRFTGRAGPGWWKSLSFSSSVNRFFYPKKNSITFSMTRGIAGHVFRMGDGVHNCWLSRNNSTFLKRILNPNHIVTPKLEKYSIENSTWIVPNSKMVSKEIASEYPQSLDKIKVIHNGFSPDSFFPVNEKRRLALKEEFGADANALHLLFCANGWKRKGLAHAISLVSRINQESKCCLWVIGRGDQKPYSKLCDALGIAKKVFFRGSQREVSKWYQMADIFVLPTSYDPFSNSCLEALACGCPVITTSSNGAGECINSRNGLVANSPEAVFTDLSVQWALTAKNLDRTYISESVSEFTIQNEIKVYLELLKSND